MIRILVSCVLLALTCPASAQFKGKEPSPIPQSPSLECAIVQATDSDRRDPIYKINVTITIDDTGAFEEMWVQHTATSGATYSRSDQYSGADIWQTPGRTEWYWRGHRGPNTMVGELWHTADDKWFYPEKLTTNGRFNYQMLSSCHLLLGG